MGHSLQAVLRLGQLRASLLSEGAPASSPNRLLRLPRADRARSVPRTLGSRRKSTENLALLLSKQLEGTGQVTRKRRFVREGDWLSRWLGRGRASARTGPTSAIPVGTHLELDKPARIFIKELKQNKNNASFHGVMRTYLLWEGRCAASTAFLSM